VTASATLCALLVGSGSARAEEIEKRFRIGFAIGGYSISDEQHSTSANVRTILKENGEFDSFFQDPRNDQGAFSDFGLEPQAGVMLSATYAFTRMWYLEGSAGIRRGTVGNVELQAQFFNAVTTVEQPFNFTVFNFEAGTIRQVPIELTAGVRFRPKAAFNPFVCGGVGYTINSFEPSDELNELSVDLDRSVGGFRSINVSGGTFNQALPAVNLSGITVDVPNAPEWHLGGGFEYTFASHWAFVFDSRYTVYSGKFKMTVNNSNELGISVPSDQRFKTDPDAFGPFGGIEISSGGLVDGGSLRPAPGFPNADCAAITPVNCEFTGPRDGVKDPGIYYIHAGSVRYDNISLHLGVRYTF
jgi:opacity protein-like surface antigen